MRARYPYQNNSDNIQEFDSNLGDIAHFAAHYEYLFAVVSVIMYVMYSIVCT